MQILIFSGDIHVNGNGRDMYKFRAIHPTEFDMYVQQAKLLSGDAFYGEIFDIGTTLIRLVVMTKIFTFQEVNKQNRYCENYSKNIRYYNS